MAVQLEDGVSMLSPDHCYGPLASLHSLPVTSCTTGDREIHVQGEPRELVLLRSPINIGTGQFGVDGVGH